MALVDEFSYMLGDDGVILNPDSLVPPFVDVTNVQGFDSAPPRVTEHDHEGTDGGFVDAEFEQSRPIIIEGTVYSGEGAPLEPFLDDLKMNWAPSTLPMPLYLKHPGVSERVAFVKPQGCRYASTQARRLGTAEVQFICTAEDPRIYSAELQTVPVPQGELIVTGRGYPRGYPYGYGAPAIANGVNIIVGGNRPTPLVISIPGPAKNMQIVNDTLGITMILDIELLAGDTMLIDTKTRSITVNGANRRTALREPDWFFLYPGNNYIRFRAESSNLTPGPAQNSITTFESGASPWAAVGGTVAQSSAQVYEGAFSLLLTPDGVTATVEARSELVQAIASRKHLLQARVRTPTTRSVSIACNWHEADGTYISTSATPTVVTANTWTLLSQEYTAPALTAQGRVMVLEGSTPPITDVIHIDNASLSLMEPTAITVQYRPAWR